MQNTFKIMPHLFSDDKIDHGIDMEALTKLSDIIGNDAKIVKKQWNRRKEKNIGKGFILSIGKK